MTNFNDDLVNSRLQDLRRSEEEKVVQAMAPQIGLDYINLHGYTINPEAINLVPEKVAREALLVAFDYTYNTVSVALKNPNDARTLQALEELEKTSRLRVIPFLCSLDSLEHGWKRYADLIASQSKTKGVFEIDATDIKRFVDAIKQKEDVAVLMSKVANSDNARRVTEILELIFAGALALRASDVHIEPEKNVVRLRYRLDGILHDVYDIDRYIYTRLMSRLKLLSGMTLNQRQEAQDGRFTFDAIDREVEIRASIIPGAGGESMVMRLLDPSVASFTLDKIDLNPILREVIAKELKKPNGLIITTGPTGSGKTTALYAFLRAVLEEGIKIITIENPVEYKLEGIVQTQTGDDYTFASGLRAVLRQDPDIIMVGEIRDKEVAETAMHAAQTGHLVFSTLHTNSAVGGFPRLIDLGIDPRMLGSAVSMLLGQRLVRRLCPECKKPYQASSEETKNISAVMKQHPKPVPIPSPLTLYKPDGCAHCNGTGYKGRVGIFEAILMDKAVEEVVIRDPREHLIAAAAEPQGIPTMLEDGVEKVVHGETSLLELERVIEITPYDNETPPTVVKEASSENKPVSPDQKNSDPDVDTFLSHVIS